MARIDTSILIFSSKNKVWATLANLEGVSDFNPVVQKSVLTSKQKQGLGATRHSDLVPKGSMDEKAIKWHEGENLTLKAYGGKNLPPFKKAQLEFTLDEEPGMTRVGLSLRYAMKFGPLGFVLDWLMVKPRFSRAVPNVLVGLKSFVETGEKVTPEVLKRAKSSR